MYMEVSKDNISNIPQINSLSIPQTSHDSIYNTFKNPLPIIILIGVVVVYIYFFYSLRSNTTSISSSSAVTFAEIFFGILFIILIFVNGTLYYFDVDITATFSKLFSKTPKVTLNLDNSKKNNIEHEKPESIMREFEDDIQDYKKEYQNDNNQQDTNTNNDNNDNNDDDDDDDNDGDSNDDDGDKEVFHIPGAYYTFDDSRAICKAYGAKLATYNQLEEVYKNGGEWCSYGWSENQQILFPTQKKTYDRLQKIPGHKNDCGRQGINGGYVSNKKARFGVNCFGVKPKQRKRDKKLMKQRKFYPVNPKQIREKRLVDHWRKQLPDILVAPYNKDEWNK